MTNNNGPPSPSLSATSTNFDFGNLHGPDVIVTRADQQASVFAYEALLSSAKAYRNAMLALASATSQFAAALEECGRQKGAQGPPLAQRNASTSKVNGFGSTAESFVLDDSDEVPVKANAGEQLMAASALHHLMGNRASCMLHSFLS